MKRGLAALEASDKKLKLSRDDDDQALEKDPRQQQTEEEEVEVHDDEELYMSYEDYWNVVAEIGCDDHNHDEEDFSDVIVRTSFHDYHLHKIILNRCNYFKMCMKRDSGFSDSNQFENGKLLMDLKAMEETFENNGSKIEKDMFDKIVNFIYCNHVEVQDADANDLYCLIQIGNFLDMKQLQDYIIQKTWPHFRIYLKERLGLELPLEELLFYSLNVVEDGNEYLMEIPEIPIEFLNFMFSQPKIPITCKLELLYKHFYQSTGKDLKEIDKSEIFTHPFVQPYSKLMHQLKEMLQQPGMTLSFIRESGAQYFAQMLCPELPSSSSTKIDIQITPAAYLEFNLEPSDDIIEEHFLFGTLLDLRIACGERSVCYWWTFQLSNLDFPYPIQVSFYIMYRNACGGLEHTKVISQGLPPLEKGESQEIGVVYGEQLYIGRVAMKGVLIVEKA
ncbi:hypothetical protein C9374_013901 [Naegleria lovaniensis]|uniref:BTB domain-containing protein n=1 Tax=Naegleria lovaniensis TaxID=51637 RepID=A0AA88GVS1_NAELO|nr:uncharacterized protein C9374_013901 [Naegleria lovaniensis]KAG2389341.1 hypothetical protein C9374_013901 [Naegleria lovaniensis]